MDPEWAWKPIFPSVVPGEQLDTINVTQFPPELHNPASTSNFADQVL